MSKSIVFRCARCFLTAVTVSCVAFTYGARAEAGVDGGTDPWRVLEEVERGVPEPARGHPGNVFVSGESVLIKVPEELEPDTTSWRVLDDRLDVVAQGIARGPELDLGELGIGWYRTEFIDSTGELLGFTTAAVLARLAEPVPQDSPVCVDAAISWEKSRTLDSKQELARLAAPAGINWIRDRLDWQTMEPRPGEFVDSTKYDALARAQTDAGMKALQVFHRTPTWAAEMSTECGRFPPDLRDAYRFCKAMSKRFVGTVQAWEPWNEANAVNFGGHTIDAICSFQKAGYLGFKAGNPHGSVCWQPIAGVNTPTMAKGILENETWPYYDTYNIHSYDWPHDYAELWEHARRAACGRPIWVTECDRGMPPGTDPPWCDYSHENAVRKAEFIAHSYACSLYAGANRHFQFLLRHYTERNHKVQFGLLRLDHTPRVSYAALAAAGRFLAGARCLGRREFEDRPDIHVYAFRGRPDGIEQDVLVAWAEKPVEWDKRGKTEARWPLPEGLEVNRVFDYLGRSLGKDAPDKLGSGACFVLMPLGEAGKLPLTKVPIADYRGGKPSPVVLQLRSTGKPPILRKVGWTQEHDWAVQPGENRFLQLYVYNFGENEAKGTVALELLPDGWEITPGRWELELAPMARRNLASRLTVPDAKAGEDPVRRVKFRGDFGDAGQPVLAFRMLLGAE